MKVSARSVTLLAVGALLLATAPASAHRQVKTDPNDTPGVFDMREATFKDKGRKFTLTLTTRGNWGVSDLGQGEPPDNQLGFALDSKGGTDIDYYVLIDKGDDGLTAGILGDGNSVVRVPVFKDGKTVGVRFKKGKVDARQNFVRWAAFTRGKGSHVGCSNPCMDNAPNNTNRLLRHDL